MSRILVIYGTTEGQTAKVARFIGEALRADGISADVIDARTLSPAPDNYDAVIVAACPPEMQVARVMARDGTSEAAARERLAAQLPIAEKVRQADYVIDTSGTFEQTDAETARVLAALRARAAT